MKISKILPFFLIIILFLIPQINCVRAKEKPNYVGIDENDVFIWKVTIDEDPYKNFLEDGGLTDEEIDDETDLLFDGLWDKDVEGWKAVILDIKDEKEFDYDGEENDVVPYLLNFYITEDYAQKDWKKEETNERGGIAKYDKDFYVWRISYILGLYYMIAANNINWEKVVDEADNELEDDWDGKDESAGARVATSLYKENGISTFWNPDEDQFDDFESTSQYNDDGVLMYYEWSYGGDPIIILELEGKFFYEYWEIILGVALIGVVVVVLVVIILKRKKSMKEIQSKLIPEPRAETKPSLQSQPQQIIKLTGEIKYCSNCGSPVSEGENFCKACGEIIK
jgi:hypothetical protein